MQILIGMLGGLSIFLYGMQLCSAGLQNAAAGKLKGILQRLTTHRVLGVIVGAVATALLQSSGATTVMLVGLTNAGLITLRQALGVILGADIGTTFTVQLIAFNIYDYALLIVFIGFIRLFTAKKQKTKFIGHIILGFGLVFYGIVVMTEAVLPLRDSPFFTNLIAHFSQQPFLALLVSALFTATIHSSAATIGLALSLSNQGLMPLATAIYIMLGANVGTTATALLSAIGTTREGKQVALAHVLFKVLGVLVFIPFTIPFTNMVARTSPDITRQIANAHTLFNVGITAVFLPFIALIAALVHRIIPKSAKDESLATPKYLDRQALGTPLLALDQAEQEVMRVGEIVRRMVHSMGNLIVAWDERIVAETKTYEEAVDSLCVDISHYLSDVSRSEMTEEESRRIVRLLHVVNDLEHIGDCIVGLGHLAQKKITGGLNFSDPGQQEMVGYYHRVRTLFEDAMQALISGDAELAKAVLDGQAEVVRDERALRETHIGRLQAGLALSRETSAIHLDVLNGLRRIADHSAGIAHTVRDGHKGTTLASQSEWTAELKPIKPDDLQPQAGA